MKDCLVIRWGKRRSERSVSSGRGCVAPSSGSECCNKSRSPSPSSSSRIVNPTKLVSKGKYMNLAIENPAAAQTKSTKTLPPDLAIQLNSPVS